MEELNQRRAADAKAFIEHDPDMCMLCSAYGADKRSLYLRCFYDIKEVVPEALDIEVTPDERFFYLRICKTCRGAFLTILGKWRAQQIECRSLPKDHDGGIEEDNPDRNIPVRVNGAIIMMTRDEYANYRAAK